MIVTMLFFYSIIQKRNIFVVHRTGLRLAEKSWPVHARGIHYWRLTCEHSYQEIHPVDT